MGIKFRYFYTNQRENKEQVPSKITSQRSNSFNEMKHFFDKNEVNKKSVVFVKCPSEVRCKRSWSRFFLSSSLDLLTTNDRIESNDFFSLELHFDPSLVVDEMQNITSILNGYKICIDICKGRKVFWFHKVFVLRNLIFALFTIIKKYISIYWNTHNFSINVFSLFFSSSSH